MALANQADVEAILGRPLTPAELARLDALVAQASALVMGHLGCPTIQDPPPDAIRYVVAAMVARILSAGSAAGGTVTGVEQESAGIFSRKFTTDASSGSPWLTKADRIALRPFRCGGLISVQLVGERYTITPTGP